jgi:nicotinate (nicotinamide) nucleotide adenylyltransferase
LSLHVFFGGSFAPPHIGHHQLIGRLLSEPEIDLVHLVPTGLNPLKKDLEFFNDEERRQLIDAWVEVILDDNKESASRLRFETFELESNQVSFTVDSLRRLKEQYSASRWVLAIGADLLPQLVKWKSASDLLAGLEAVWVFQRAGYTLNPGQIPEELRGLCSWRFFPESFEWVSSTELREAEQSPDALQAKLRPYLLDNVFEVLLRLLQQKNRE